MPENDRKWAMSCYVPIFNIIFCVFVSVRKADSRFCRFHARQGLILFFLWFLTIIVALISQTLSLMLWGVVLLLHGAGAFIAYTNKETKIPVIGHFAAMIPEFYIFTLLTGKKPESAWLNPENVPDGGTGGTGSGTDQNLK
ncbi:MAG: hypothetical protein ABIH78_01085 [Candidatus Peregrinibacteria bacterium]